MSPQSSIELPGDGDCAFCAYLRGDRPYTILSANSETATLVTREQRGDPHLLVLPRRHFPTILELTDREAASIAIAVREAAIAIDRTYSRPAIAVWQNNGIFAGQAIPHLHFHVAGVSKEGGTERGAVRELSIAETDTIADQIRDAGFYSDPRT